MNSLELFSGAGGLALGVTLSGYNHEALIERDAHACKTLRMNARFFNKVSNPLLHRGDVTEFEFKLYEDKVDLVAGGPPCQPFSLGGKHRGCLDSRDMFPEMVRAVREIRPKAVIIENVKGLLRESFATYFEYILLQLTFPEIHRKEGEDISSHLARLERQQSKGRFGGLEYNVNFRAISAADYGVSQRRERVLIVGLRSDLNAEWAFPAQTHSLDSLLWSQWISGDYWREHLLPPQDLKNQPKAVRAKVNRLLSNGEIPALKRWETVRDALKGLPDPKNTTDRKHFLNHIFKSGAKAYKGHTGSPMDMPAKTLKAGVHGVPGGENMMIKDDGKVRYFTVRESARLQAFPDDYGFSGCWTEAMRQIGNAVPVTVGRIISHSISRALGAKVES